MQQIYRRTLMPKCDLKKLLSSFIEIELWYGCSPIHLLHIFRTFFAKNTSGRLLLHFVSYWCYSYHIFTLFKNDHVLVTLHNNVFLKKLKVVQVLAFSNNYHVLIMLHTNILSKKFKVSFMNVYMGYFIIGVQSSERVVLALLNLEHVIIRQCSKKECALFVNFFLSKEHQFFLAHFYQ